MGACLSCLGLGRQQSYEDERAPLLSDNYRAPYGADSQAAARVDGPDPEYLRREREALDGICHSMSDHVIDVFTIQPPQGAGAATPKPESMESLQKIFGDLTPEEMQLRTIRKGTGRPVYTPVGKAGEGWQAVQSAIG